MKTLGWTVTLAAALWIGWSVWPRPAPVDPGLQEELDSLALELEAGAERLERVEAERDSIARANADSIASWNAQRSTFTRRIQATTARAAEIADSIRARLDAETAELFEEDERLDAQALEDAWAWGETWKREAEAKTEELAVADRTIIELRARVGILERRDSVRVAVNHQLRGELQDERRGRTRDRVVGGLALVACVLWEPC